MRQYVGVVLVKEDGSVLAQHRDNNPKILGPDTWAVVGGARDETDSDLRDTGARELFEETDYVVRRSDLRFLAWDNYVTEKGVAVERVILWAIYDGQQKINTNEGQEIRFLKPTELSCLNFYTGHQVSFRKASEKVFGRRIESEK